MASPARKLKKSSVKNISQFPSIKANDGDAILVESLLESKYCFFLEFDPDVVEYFPQPETFFYLENGRKKKYTPDFLVIYKNCARKYIEVKPAYDASKEKFQLLFKWASVFFASIGAEFEHVSEKQIELYPLLENYDFLYSHRKRPKLDHLVLHEAKKIFVGLHRLEELLIHPEITVDLRDVYTWLALGYLKFDITAERLSMKSEVTFDE